MFLKYCGPRYRNILHKHSIAVQCIEQSRTYAFLNNLPRLVGGISKFGKIKQSIPSETTEKSPPPKQGSPNRFAQKYSEPRTKASPTKPQNNAQKTRAPSPEANKLLQYEAMKKSLREKQKQAKPQQTHKKSNKKSKFVEPIQIQLPPFVTVSNLATIMNIPLNDVFRKLEGLGFEDIRHNYILDKENASLIADEYNFEVTISEESKDDLFPSPIVPELLRERPPVVTIMGHVDHGKTTILDYLRKSSIVDKEFGGITQHIGAFSVLTPISKKKITFLDTPGHAAFLKMRERGAIITDIVILVVAADDSVMPQTIEAIKHSKKSGVPIIVAINKCDKHGVKTDKVLSDLAANDIDIEDYGGDTQTVKVSGKTGLNMDKLEEAIITLSEMNDFKSEYTDIQSEGWIIESEIVKGFGSIATILVRRGTIKVGDFLVAGNTYCKVRGMKDEFGKTVKSAGPSTPIQIWGWKELPEGGDQVLQAKNEQVAKKVTQYRISRDKEIQASRDIESINQKRQDEIKDLKKLEKINELKSAGLDSSYLENEEDKNTCIDVKYIIKSDVFGSAEAIKESIHDLGNEEVKSIVLSHEAGPPTENDVDLAKTLNAKIFCFNVKVPKLISNKAEKEGVCISEHNIIYRLIEEVTSELTSHLKPRIEVKTLGEVELKDVFVVSVKKSKVKIAGCKVTTGYIKKSSKVKVKRKGEIVYDGTLSSLKHIKDDISEARKGNECGISFEKWDKFELGDVIEVYEEIEHPRFL